MNEYKNYNSCYSFKCIIFFSSVFPKYYDSSLEYKDLLKTLRKQVINNINNILAVLNTTYIL